MSTVNLLVQLVEVIWRPGEQDVRILLQEHDAKRNAVGRPARDLEVFKRAGLILTVTWWESYVEGAIDMAVRERLRSAQSPSDIGGTFQSIAQAWLNAGKGKAPKPIELMAWTGDQWKDRIQKRFQEDLEALHTPNSKNIRLLSKRYLESDITRSWRWSGTNSERACDRLDHVIKRRGEIVHQGRRWRSEGDVRKREVVEALDLVGRLVGCTSRALSAIMEGTQ